MFECKRRKLEVFKRCELYWFSNIEFKKIKKIKKCPFNITKHRVKDLISFVWTLPWQIFLNWSILFIVLLLFTCFIICHQEIWDWVLRHAGQDWCPPLQWKQHWARHSLWKILQGVHTGNHWPRWVSAFNQTLYNNVCLFPNFSYCEKTWALLVQ